MRILFDIAHPAHVHFFRHMIPELKHRGHATSILSRDKDVTTRLLDAFGMEHTPVGRPSRRGRPGQLMELVSRNLALVRHGRRFKADVVVTRNPAGVQAARLLGATGIFDTDDGYSAGVHFRAALPFAHYITSPDCLAEDLGPRHVKYAGYKQSAYLHPDHYTPDPGILAELGLGQSDRYFVVRFVALLASHDKGEAGMPMALKRDAIAFLERHGRVFVSSESELPAEWKHLEFRLQPHRAHDLLAFATLVLGDSASMPIEAAVLGTPALHVSSYTGRLRPLNELEHRYGLAWSYEPTHSAPLMAKLKELVSQPHPRHSVAAGHARMLAEKINVADWFCDFIERVGTSRPGLRRAG
jgi:predicted glycosyltransferase